MKTAKDDAIQFIQNVIKSHTDELEVKRQHWKKTLKEAREKTLKDRKLERKKQRRLQAEQKRQEELELENKEKLAKQAQAYRQNADKTPYAKTAPMASTKVSTDQSIEGPWRSAKVPSKNPEQPLAKEKTEGNGTTKLWRTEPQDQRSAASLSSSNEKEKSNKYVPPRLRNNN